LFVSPEPINAVFAPGWRGIEGSAVEVDEVFGGTSGRFEVAEVFARVFPARKAFVQGLIDDFGQEYKFGPYPNDKLIVQTERLVEYQTARRSEGLGTMNRLRANDDPIDGVAIIEEPTPNLRMLRVRLPLKQRDLAPVIIQQLLLRERSDTR
jgi:hypothetical protein